MACANLTVREHIFYQNCIIYFMVRLTLVQKVGLLNHDLNTC